MTSNKLGVWIIGAKGSVAACLIAGVKGILDGRFSRAGLSTESRDFAALNLAAFEDLVFGGYDIRSATLHESVREFAQRTNAIPGDFVQSIREHLLAVDGNILAGTALNCGDAISRLKEEDTLEDTLHYHGIFEKIQQDLADFKARHKLRDVIVVNLASTEPYAQQPSSYRSLDSFRKSMQLCRSEQVAASVIYAYAVIDAGYPYINFTPSPGSSIDAILELAEERGVPHMGRDGKTGETLLKTALAPLFAARHFNVLSWSGFNILGNRDGQVLSTPDNCKAKVNNKQGVLDSILNQQDPVQSLVRIDYVPSLDDWKTAWDFIHFSGFMDVKMSLQFTWQGCDSVLAAPLVLDMVRLADFARRTGEKGLMKHLALFFKSPTGVETHDFWKQVEMLKQYARIHSERALAK